MKKLDETSERVMLDACKIYNEWLAPFEKRIHYILTVIGKECYGSLDWWDWREEGDSFNPDMNMAGGVVSFHAEWRGNSFCNSAIIDGHEWDFSHEFPIRFLYEDFENELRVGVKTFKEQEQLKKDKAKASREKKKLEKDAALSKLSKEDKKALGL